MAKRKETYEERLARKIREEEERLRNKPGITKPTTPLRKETYEERTARKIREEEERTKGKATSVNRFFEGEQEDEESERIERYYPGTTLDLDSRPILGKIADIFDEQGWSSWRDALDLSLVNPANHNPQYDRPGLYATLQDAILEAYDIGILDFTNFYRVGGFWHLYVMGS